MQQEELLLAMQDKIEQMKTLAKELKELSNGVPAVDCNLKRITASINMLEINVSDLAEL
jgi:hypothetical protein